MEKKTSPALLISVTSAVLVTCACALIGPSSEELTAQATQIAGQIFETQTAEAPTITPTPEPSQTPTQTYTPSPSPTTTPTPKPDLWGLITLDDLPPDFEEMPPSEFGMSEEDLGGQADLPESFFAFHEPVRFETIVGFTVLLPTRVEQTQFDNLQEIYIDMMLTLMGVEESEWEELPGLDDIGDKSVGVTATAKLEGIPVRWDIVVFRRDTVGASVFIMYIDGDIPSVSLGDLARLIDDRIATILDQWQQQTTANIVTPGEGIFCTRRTSLGT